MRVYRVEHIDSGNGPYTYDNDLYDEDIPYDLDGAHSGWGSSHAPWRAWTDSYDETCRAGFAELWHLRLWFSGFLRRMLDDNFVVAEYEVDERFVQHAPSFIKDWEDNVIPLLPQLIFIHTPDSRFIRNVSYREVMMTAPVSEPNAMMNA